MSHYLIYPSAFYVFYIVSLIVYNLSCRLKSIKSKEISPKYFKNYADKTSLPERLIVLERHIDNQFQLPTIFLATCAAHMATSQVNFLTIILAWLFVISRLFHTYIHLGSNNVLHRAQTYGVGLIVIIVLWAQLIQSAL